MITLRDFLFGEKRQGGYHPSADPPRWLIGSAGTAAGEHVDRETVRAIPTAHRAVSFLADSIVTLPFGIFRETEGELVKNEKNHPVSRLLHTQPNPHMTAADWRAMSVSHLAYRGNCYSFVERDGAGKVRHLWPLNPDEIQPFLNDKNKLLYYYRPKRGRETVFFQEEVLHVKINTEDGILGESPISFAANAFGNAMAANNYAGRVYKNDATPRGVLQIPQTLNDEAIKRLRSTWEAVYGGGTSRIGILEQGAEFKPISISPEDSQLIEVRRFNREDIATIFGVPPHKVGIMDKATFSNIEHQAIEFVVDTLLPLLKRFELAIDTTLLTLSSDKDLFAKFNVEGRLRGDTKSRYESYAVGRQWGWLSANDIRALENMNPIEGGDKYLVPLNMVDAQSEEPLEIDESVVDEPANDEDRGQNLSPIGAKEVFTPVVRSFLERVTVREQKALRSAARNNKNEPHYRDLYEKLEKQLAGDLESLLPAYRFARGTETQVIGEAVIAKQIAEDVFRGFAEQFLELRATPERFLERVYELETADLEARESKILSLLEAEAAKNEARN